MKGPDAVRFTAPPWHRFQVHAGDFAVEKGRASCSLIIKAALTTYLANLRQTGKYLSLFEQVTALAPKPRSLDEFASEFGFSRPLRQYTGLGPVACAALLGDAQLLRRLAAARASLSMRPKWQKH